MKDPNPNMNRLEAFKMDRNTQGAFYAELDEDSGLFCVFGVESGFAYASYADEGEAQQKAIDMNLERQPEDEELTLCRHPIQSGEQPAAQGDQGDAAPAAGGECRGGSDDPETADFSLALVEEVAQEQQHLLEEQLQLPLVDWNAASRDSTNMNMYEAGTINPEDV
jgi:hypothetical protein